MINFRQKDFSNYILGDAIKGAGAGLAIGAGVSKFNILPEKIKGKFPGKTWYNKARPEYQYQNKWNDNAKRVEDIYWDNRNQDDRNYLQRHPEVKVGDIKTRQTTPGSSAGQKLLFTVATTILGAALGAIVGAIRTGMEKHSQHNTNQRLLKRILPRLKSKGLREGEDYTMDPKKANEIPTKVCIVLSSASGELQTVINSKDDPKLKKTVDQIVRKSSGRTRVTTQNNRFNEITITTEKNTAANVNQVVSIIESFVESGYPVYIVEVG